MASGLCLDCLRQKESSRFYELFSLTVICSQPDSTSTQDLVDTVDRFIETFKDCVPKRSAVARLLRWLNAICEKFCLYPRSIYAGGRVVFNNTPPLQNGASSDVYRGFHLGKSSGQVAIKCTRMFQSNLKVVRKRFVKEAMIMRTLRHPHIIPFVGVLEEPRGLCILTKWMPNGSVISYLTHYPNASRERLVCDIADGLLYLESSGVVHGDLKGDNILVDEKHNVRIADFGSARFLASAHERNEAEVIASTIVDRNAWLSASSTSTGGTYRFLAPELVLVESTNGLSGPTHASDIFSLGMVVYQMYSGRLPLDHIRWPLTAALRMQEGERPTGPPSNMPGYIWQLAQDCWAQDPAHRPTAEEVYNKLVQLDGRVW